MKQLKNKFLHNMTKNLFYPKLWGILALSLLFSCRTEDNITQQKQEKDMRFAVFVPKDGKTVNYANGFAFLMQRYDNLYKTNLSGINNSKPILGNLNASTNKNALVVQATGVYIEFKIHSQTYTEENGNKWVVYPRVENGKVIDLVMAILSNKGTYVRYGIIDNQNELYTLNIDKFQDAVNKYLRQSKFLNLNASIKPMAEGAGCKNENGEYVDCEVPGVDLTKPAKPKEPEQIIRPFDPGEGGGCPMYANCLDTGGGGAIPLPTIDDSCSKMKNKIATEKGREIIKDLEAKAKVPGSTEYAYRQDKNGETKMYQGERDNVSIPIDNNMEGVYHDHQSEGVAMLSVRDIRMMLIAARMQSDDNVGNAFVGMISTYGNYFINFNGTKADIPVITEGQMINDLIKFYDEDYTAMQVRLPKGAKELPPDQLEKLFFNTIEKMGLKDKVNLFREKDGSTSQVKLDVNGEPVPSNPC